MSQHYNQNYTREDIDIVLGKVTNCIENDRYTISLNENRQENINFINEYNISSDKQKNILMKIETDDFCHSLKNLNPRFSHEILYVFVPQTKLYNAEGYEENVEIYTKFNVIEMTDGNKAVVISFHKPNKPVDFLLK